MSRNRRPAPQRAPAGAEIIKDPASAGPGSYLQVEGGYVRTGQTTEPREVAEGREPARDEEALAAIEAGRPLTEEAEPPSHPPPSEAGGAPVETPADPPKD